MKVFVLLTVLNSGHNGEQAVQIRTADIKAMRSTIAGCYLSHKDFEEEILVKEKCSTVVALAQKPEKAKSVKSKGGQAWFQ